MAEAGADVPPASEVDGDLPPEVVALVGVRCYETVNDAPVEAGVARLSCASVHNANPLFWDDAVAAALTGGPVLPPSTLSRWSRPHPWTPTGGGDAVPLQLHFDLKERFDLPDAVVSRSELEAHEPVRPGDTIAHAQILRSVSPIRTTALGPGRFWVIDTEYRNQRGELVGIEATTGFGYRAGAAPSAPADPSGSAQPAAAPPLDRPADEPAGRPTGRSPEPSTEGAGQPVRLGAVEVGLALPPVAHAVTATTVVLGAAAANDWRPVHHDVDAARRSGAADVFLDTPTQAAWFERVVTDWTGPTGRIGRLSVRMARPVVPGATMTLSGAVTDVAVDPLGCGWVEVAVTLAVAGETRSAGTVRVAVPVDDGDNPWARSGDAWRP